MQYVWKMRSGFGIEIQKGSNKVSQIGQINGENTTTIEENKDLDDEHINEQNNASSSSEKPKKAPQIPNQGRSRKKPTWLNDYVTSEELSKEEESQNLVMFTSTEDPATFEEASKNEK